LPYAEDGVRKIETSHSPAGGHPTSAYNCKCNNSVHYRFS
jgi:hypothetical protein